MVGHVFSMERSRETKVDGFLKKRSILGHFLEVLEFRGANLIKPSCAWDDWSSNLGFWSN